MNIHIYIQARMGSTRLPGKVLLPILNKPLLGYLLERLKRVQLASNLVVLTSQKKDDDAIEAFSLDQGVPCFRGPQDHVLERYFLAAQKFQPDAIVRITADCPLMDPDLVDLVIKEYITHFPQYDYVSNTLERSFPRGYDIEIFSMKALADAYYRSKDPQEHEHVTVHFYKNEDQFRIKNVQSPIPLPDYRLTVDTPEDFELIKHILEDLYPKHPNFSINDVIELLQRNPDWVKINAQVKQKELLIKKDPENQS